MEAIVSSFLVPQKYVNSSENTNKTLYTVFKVIFQKILQ